MSDSSGIRSFLKPKVAAYFWSKVEARSGRDTRCWEWRGLRSNAGYGKFNLPTPNGPMSIGAHRIAYVLATSDDISSDDSICHHCDNPPCCNPDHLFKGTALENNHDAFQKGRNVPPREHTNYVHAWKKRPELIRRGSQVHWATLTEDRVRQILMDRINGASVPEIAAKYGRSKEGIGQICSGRKWKHVYNSLSLEQRSAMADVRERHRVARKIDLATAIDIKKQLAAGVPIQALAKKHDVCIATIQHIRQGRSFPDA